MLYSIFIFISLASSPSINLTIFSFDFGHFTFFDFGHLQNHAPKHTYHKCVNPLFSANQMQQQNIQTNENKQLPMAHRQ
jgi:hypothetical protein